MSAPEPHTTAGCDTVRAARTARRVSPEAAAGVLGALALFVAPYALPTSLVFVLNQLLVAVLFAASLNLLMGFGRMISFGHAAYFALGGYTAALLVKAAALPTPVAMAAGPLAAALGALVFGYFCVRSSRAYFIMLTLAFAQLLYSVIMQWYGLTHGDDGLSGVWPSGVIGSPRSFYQFSVVVVGLSCLVLHRVIRSPFGTTLRAIGQNARRAEFLGLATRRYRLAAFVLSGFFAGVAGMLFAFYNGSVSPDIAYWTESAKPFIAVILGGPESFWGAIAGSTVLSLLDNQVAHYTQYAEFWVGVVALAAGLFLRRGFAGASGGARRP